MATVILKPGETLEQAIKRFTNVCRTEGVFKDMKRAAEVKRTEPHRVHVAFSKRLRKVQKRDAKRREQIR